MFLRCLLSHALVSVRNVFLRTFSFSCLVLISSTLEQLLLTDLSLRTDFLIQVIICTSVCKPVLFPCNRGAICHDYVSSKFMVNSNEHSFALLCVLFFQSKASAAKNAW